MSTQKSTRSANFLIVSIKEPSGVSTYFGSSAAVNAELEDLKNQVRVRTLAQDSFETKEKMQQQLNNCKGELINADYHAGYSQQLA